MPYILRDATKDDAFAMAELSATVAGFVRPTPDRDQLVESRKTSMAADVESKTKHFLVVVCTSDDGPDKVVGAAAWVGPGGSGHGQGAEEEVGVAPSSLEGRQGDMWCRSASSCFFPT
jgi:hypothetical protein